MPILFNDFPRVLHAELDGYWEPRSPARASALRWLDELANEVVLATAEGEWWSDPGTAGMLPRPSFETGPRAEIVTQKGGDVWRKELWTESLHGFLEGAIDEVGLHFPLVVNDILHTVRTVANAGQRSEAIRIRVELPVELFGDRLPRHVQDAVFEAWTRGAERLRPATGHMTIDNISELTAHEVDHGLDPALRHLSASVRGYQWATLIGPGHIAALGGRASVLARAPVSGVIDVGSSDGDPLILKLSEDVNDVTDSQLAELKRYLVPVLISGPPRYEAYFGSPVRAMRDEYSIERIDLRRDLKSPADIARFVERGLAAMPVGQELTTWPRINRHRSLDVDLVGEPDLESLNFRFVLERPLRASEIVSLQGLLDSVLHSSASDPDQHVSYVSRPVQRVDPGGHPVVEWWMDAVGIGPSMLRHLIESAASFAAAQGPPYLRLVVGGVLT